MSNKAPKVAANLAAAMLTGVNAHGVPCADLKERTMAAAEAAREAAAIVAQDEDHRKLTVTLASAMLTGVNSHGMPCVDLKERAMAAVEAAGEAAKILAEA